MMKKLVAITLLFLSVGTAFSQDVQIVELPQDQEVKAPENWKERFWDLTHEERGALFADPEVDPEEIMTFIKENRSKLDIPVKRAGGDEAIFGCTFWYDHDMLAAQELADNNWQLFDGGCGAGQGVDAYWGQVNLDFDFCLLGATYNHFYINTKGTLSFTEPQCDWTPDQFPAANEWNQVAGFWSDFDFTVSGLCFWEVDQSKAVVTFLNVGYWPGQGGLTNTMQMVITDGADPILPPQYNVGFFYGQMGWCHGGVGGSAGCCGPNPAIVGIDRSNNTDGLQIGMFNELSGEFYGPYGESGVHWLDNKQLFIKACEYGDELTNHPPIPTNNNAMLDGVWPEYACDTIRVCLNDTADLFASYLGPEQGETVTLTIDDSNIDNLIILQNDPGIEAQFHGQIVGATEYIGFHTLDITATDDGSPAQSVTQTFVIEILDVAAPQISIAGDEAICAGQDAVWTVEPEGLDYYIWSSGDQGVAETEVEIGYGGDFWVQAFQDGCVTQEFFNINESTYFLPIVEYDPSPFACDGAPVEVCLTNQDYPEMWFDCLDPTGDDFPCPDPGYWDGPCAMLEPGFYIAHAMDEEGCEGQNVFQIQEQASFIPDLEFDAFCGELTPAVFEGGFANPGEGNLDIWMTDAEGNYGNGSFLIITVNGEQFTFAMINGGTFDWNTIDQQIPIEWGDEIVVEYVAAGTDDGNQSLQIFNCGDNTPVYDGSPNGSGILWEGTASCTAEPATGVWTQESCPCDGTFADTGQFNTTFTPCEEGTYNLQFEESVCNVVHEFYLEYTDTPTGVALTPAQPQLLCPGESIDFEADYNVPTDCDLDISWTVATPDGNDISLASYDAPGICATETVIFEVENGCGSVQATVAVESQEDIDANLEDEVFCEGDPVTICPVENPSSCLTFEWNNGETDPCIEVVEGGFYQVDISNDCDDVTVSANVGLASAFYAPGPYDIVECDNDEYVISAGNVPPGYTWYWGSDPNVNVNEPTFTVDQIGQFTVFLQVTDNLGCDQYTTEFNIAIDDYPVLNPTPSADTLYICPNEIELLNLGYGDGTTYSWEVDCVDMETFFTETDILELGSDQFPPACLEQFLTLTAVADNICPGDEEHTWTVQASLCPTKAPNVFTPNEDALANDLFILEGIEVFDHTELYVYNRWGELIYEDMNYQNSWRATDVPDGVYYYVARMIDSTDQVVREVESYLHILR